MRRVSLPVTVRGATPVNGFFLLPPLSRPPVTATDAPTGSPPPSLLSSLQQPTVLRPGHAEVAVQRPTMPHAARTSPHQPPRGLRAEATNKNDLEPPAAPSRSRTVGFGANHACLVCDLHRTTRPFAGMRRKSQVKVRCPVVHKLATHKITRASSVASTQSALRRKSSQELQDVKRRENRRYLVVLFRARRSSHTTARPFRASHAHLTGAQRIATSLIGQERTATRLTPPSSKIQTGTCVSDRDRTHIRIVQKRLRGRGRAKALRCPRGGSSSPCRPRGARARVFEIHIKSCLSQRHHWLS